ncbi:UNVERIFIED_CONTAM: hypothetical protein Sangu_2717100 [Sesamum angustifolium]|uniref:Uncharacterized protein n=1 Tax=Sesamum angustifolium TaxID=2727405 RepID=A0AAW2IXM5_9LAMI
MGGLELGVGVERLALLSFSWLCNYEDELAHKQVSGSLVSSTSSRDLKTGTTVKRFPIFSFYKSLLVSSLESQLPNKPALSYSPLLLWYFRSSPSRIRNRNKLFATPLALLAVLVCSLY